MSVPSSVVWYELLEEVLCSLAGAGAVCQLLGWQDMQAGLLLVKANENEDLCAT
jgi:hypothetical protein